MQWQCFRFGVLFECMSGIMTRKSCFFVFLLIFVFSGNCMAFGNKKEVAHLCLMSGVSKVVCARSSEYVGTFRVFNDSRVKDEKIMDFDVSKEKTINNVDVYKIRIKNNNEEWCFDFLGQKSKIHRLAHAGVLNLTVNLAKDADKPAKALRHSFACSHSRRIHRTFARLILTPARAPKT